MILSYEIITKSGAKYPFTPSIDHIKETRIEWVLMGCVAITPKVKDPDTLIALLKNIDEHLNEIASNKELSDKEVVEFSHYLNIERFEVINEIERQEIPLFEHPLKDKFLTIEELPKYTQQFGSNIPVCVQCGSTHIRLYGQIPILAKQLKDGFVLSKRKGFCPDCNEDVFLVRYGVFNKWKYST